MTDQLDTAIIKAGLDLLRADLGLNVQDGYVANLTPRPYVRVDGWVGRPKSNSANAMDGISRTFVTRWYCHCVGETRESASAVEQRVRTQLLDVRLTVPGHPTLGIDPIEQESAEQPVPDETTGLPVWTATCVYKARITL